MFVRRKTMFIISSVTMLACLHVPVAHSATYSCLGRAATKVGIPGPDTLNGTNRSDVIVGLDGMTTSATLTATTASAVALGRTGLEAAGAKEVGRAKDAGVLTQEEFDAQKARILTDL